MADSYDAMTSTRPYRPAMEMSTVLAEIEANKDKQWRGDVAEAFLKCLEGGIIEKMLVNQNNSANI